MRWGYGYAVQVGAARATLWITRIDTHPAGFAVEQLRSHRNSAPDPELAQYIQRWLTAQGEWNRFRSEQGPQPSGPERPPVPDTWLEKRRHLDPMVEMLLADDIPF